VGPGREAGVSRVLVLGGAGMLGHKLHHVLSHDHEVVSVLRGGLPAGSAPDDEIFRRGRVVEGVDVTDLAATDGLLAELTPDVVVNCVGIVKQRPAAADPIPSISVNALLPHRLEDMCSRRGARLVHFSSDCVFSGDRGGYTEEDVSDARDLYGRTKFLGEVGPPGLTIRSSIIGRELAHFQSLLEWFLRQRGTVSGFTRVMYSGVTTIEMARIVDEVLSAHPELAGLYQVASPAISKFDLLTMVRDAFGLDTVVVPDEGAVSDRTLSGERFLAATGIETSTWHDMIEGLVKEASLYPEPRPR